MDIQNSSHHPWRRTMFSYDTSLCALVFLVYLCHQETFSNAAGQRIVTFDNFDGNELSPTTTCAGWSVEQTDYGNYAIATCTRMCKEKFSVIKNYINLSGVMTLAFQYALYSPDSSGAVSKDSHRLKVSCKGDLESKPLWTSNHVETPGAWVQAGPITFKATSSTVDILFEANLGENGQAIGLDNVTLRDGNSYEPPLLSQDPIQYPEACSDDPRDRTDDAVSIPGDDNGHVTPIIRENVTTDQPVDLITTPQYDPEVERKFGLLDNETTFLLAQLLAILSVAACFITVGIHCMIWQKQRRLQRVRSIVPLRHHRKPPVADEEAHDSMLLEMNLVSTEEQAQPCSNSSTTEVNQTRYMQELLGSDARQQHNPRRATVSHGASPLEKRRGSGGEANEDEADGDSDDDEEFRQHTHPRTKSLPGRPSANVVYESIDEMNKYQPLTFGDKAAADTAAATAAADAAAAAAVAAANKPTNRPGIPGRNRLSKRTLGVHDLAAARRYRMSSVLYEEIGNRGDGLVYDEPRDRSKSACHYDYVKKKAGAHGPAGRIVRRYTHSKGRAPAPPAAVNRLYDEPRKTQGEKTIGNEQPKLNAPSSDMGSNLSAAADILNTTTNYFTLEPPTVDSGTNSGDSSDDEHESDKDPSRFEDAEETLTGTPSSGGILNGTDEVPKRSAPIVIPPPSSTNRLSDFEMETSRL